MRATSLIVTAIAVSIANGFAGQDSADGPYKVLKTAKGVARAGSIMSTPTRWTPSVHSALRPTKRISVFDLDTLQPAGEIPYMSAHGAAVDPSRATVCNQQTGVMWDTATLKVIKTIDVQGNPMASLRSVQPACLYPQPRRAERTVIDRRTARAGNHRPRGAPERLSRWQRASLRRYEDKEISRLSIPKPCK